MGENTGRYAQEAANEDGARPRSIVGDYRQSKRQDCPKRGARGYDAGKKIKGRKRHIITDITGHLLAAYVHGANEQDRDGAKKVLEQIANRPRLQVVLADGAYGGKLQNWFMLESKGKRLEIVKRSELKQFVVQPKRWIVKRTFGWLNWLRRLSKDYEHNPLTSYCRLFIADTFLIVKKLSNST